ncbi:hypothetical protein Nepgr_001417 [Nepenthes gracilis]|uniref:Uncharacterized protein n=1 Tax=Nepenthes gracilis TaxID=150966 RepID=A0AAD3P542_NEPGR|nr:hypothetical protein Nepgr_001417 [Nepenthes gracilis]
MYVIAESRPKLASGEVSEPMRTQRPRCDLLVMAYRRLKYRHMSTYMGSGGRVADIPYKQPRAFTGWWARQLDACWHCQQ